MTCTTTSMLSRLTGTTASELRGHRLALGCLLPGRPYAVCVEVRCSSRWAARRGTHRCRAGGRLICGRDWPGPSLAPLALVALVALVSFALLTVALFTVALLGLFPLALLPLAPIAAAPIRSGPVTGMPISLGPVTCMPISFASITCMAIVFALLMVGARHDGRSNAGVAVACRAASRPMGCAAGGCPPR